jgi:hypothetical protein
MKTTTFLKKNQFQDWNWLYGYGLTVEDDSFEKQRRDTYGRKNNAY